VPTRLSVDGHAIAEAEDLAVRTELWARYRAVRQEADALIGQLQTAALGVIAPTDGAAELATARRWGVIPSLASEDAGPIDRRVFELESAGETLLSRLEKAPADTVNPPATLTIEQIGAAIAELVKPGGRLPVFSRVAPPALAATEPALRRPLVAEPFEAIPLPGQSGAGRNRLDGTWLDIVAAVRPAAARIESWQLHALVGAGPSMKAWTNWPGNPWRQGVPPPAGDVRSTVDALVVVYTPAASLNLTSAALVAAITIDTWTETIPSETQTVGAAFGFNAPAARPPQAILVAVPPKDDTPLDGDTLLDIVVETRELVHARMATPEDLQSLAAALPMTLVESRYADPAGLKLGDWEEQ